MDAESAKEYLKDKLTDYVRMITQPSKGEDMYNCPLCGSGTKKNGTGAFNISKNGRRWKCFSCGESGDLFELIGKYENIPDYMGQLRRAGDLFGVTIDRKRSTAQEDFKPEKQAGSVRFRDASGTDGQPTQPTQQNLHNTTYTIPQAKQEQEPDYTAFYEQAAKNIDRTSYHRGLTRKTLDRFKIGYIENYNHHNGGARGWNALIIPTSAASYVIRNTNESADKDHRYRKQGKTHFLNGDALTQSSQPVFIVEGELDALSIIDAGGEAVALGSAASAKNFIGYLEEHKPSQPLIIALDNDEAGAKAAEDLAADIEKLSLSGYIINPYGTKKDANEALMADREAFAAAVNAAIDRARAEEAEALEAERQEQKKEAALYCLQDFVNNIKKSKTEPIISTGFPALDKALGGGLYAGLYIVGALTSLGKTSFVLQIADQIAQAGRDVLIFSLEMARDELIAKSISRLTLIKDLAENGTTRNAKTTRGILTGRFYDNYSQTERDLIKASIDEYGKYSGHIYITQALGEVGVKEINEKIQQYIRLNGKPPVVVIDYIQILAPADVRATDKQNTDKAVLELKKMSRAHGIPVIGISSFNRENYTAPVNLASFKESGAIEYSSDVLIGLQYEGMDYQEGETDKARDKRIRTLIKEAEQTGRNGEAQRIEVKILKHRNGSKGSSLLLFYPKFNYFLEDPADENTQSGGWTRSEGGYQTGKAKTKPQKPAPEDEDADELPL